MADEYAKNFATGIVNRKKNLEDREKKAMGEDDAPDPKKGIDKGNLPSPEGFQMSQGQFSGYPQTKTKK